MSHVSEVTDYSATSVDAAATGISWGRRLLLSPVPALLLVIVVFVVFGASQTDAFLNPQTWVNILREASFPMIAAVFMTIVLVTGGLDLSVGSVFVAGAMTSAAIASGGYGVFPAIAGGILIGAAVGLVNGSLINYVGINAIIVTLGTLFAVRSVVTTLSGGKAIGGLPDSFTSIGQGFLFGVPNVVFIALVVAGVAFVILHLTTVGWAIRAIGGNRDAARSAGINVKRLSTLVYVMSGSAAAFAGVLMASRLGSGPPSMGVGFELTVIAAAIIGGTSIAGAIGTIPGTMLGTLLLSILAMGLVLLKVDPTLTNLFTGVVLILAAGIDVLRRRQMFRTSTKAGL